jgi:hypothetical protein
LIMVIRTLYIKWDNYKVGETGRKMSEKFTY